MTVRLIGITWDHPRGFSPVADTVDNFIAGRDIEIHWERRSLQSFADQSVAELAGSYDLIVLDHPHIGQAIREGALTPLDGLVAGSELMSLGERSIGASHESYASAGRQWALAIDAACQVSAVRRDLLSESPNSWEHVLELSERGRVLWPLKPVDAICSFESIAANFGTPCAESSEYIAVDDGIRVLELMERLARNVPAFCLSKNPIEILDILSQESNYIYSPLLFGYTNYSRIGFRKHIVHFLDIPSAGLGPKGAILGGAGIAVSSSCRHVDIAAEYAAWLASGDVQRTYYVQSAGQPAHADAWDDPEANSLCSDFFYDTRRTMDLSWLRPRHAGFIEFQERAGAAINSHLSEAAISHVKLVESLNDLYNLFNLK